MGSCFPKGMHEAGEVDKEMMKMKNSSIAPLPNDQTCCCFLWVVPK
jgi:hypothetical protein